MRNARAHIRQSAHAFIILFAQFRLLETDTVLKYIRGEKMKVIKKQTNSKSCIICGLDNAAGVKAPFYEMEDGSVVTLFSYSAQHQSYPGRVRQSHLGHRSLGTRGHARYSGEIPQTRPVRHSPHRHRHDRKERFPRLYRSCRDKRQERNGTRRRHRHVLQDALRKDHRRGYARRTRYVRARRRKRNRPAVSDAFLPLTEIGNHVTHFLQRRIP